MLKEITIQFTEKCNAGCSYCFAPIKSEKHLSADNFDIFKNFCVRTKPEIIHVTGGEPTINPNFAKFITELAKISSLVVYTNFTIPNVIDNIDADSPSSIVFLVNTTSKLFCTNMEKENMELNVQKALNKGFRVALSYTFFDPDISLENQFDYLMKKMRDYHLRNLRLSQALNFNDQQKFLDRSSIKKLYHYVSEHVSGWRADGFSVYFDCPIPPCYISSKDYKRLRDNNAVSVKCIPKVFVMWDLEVTHCYSTMGIKDKKKLTDFNDLDEARDYSANILREIQSLSERRGCYKCKYGEDGIPCGCPTYCV